MKRVIRHEASDSLSTIDVGASLERLAHMKVPRCCADTALFLAWCTRLTVVFSDDVLWSRMFVSWAGGKGGAGPCAVTTAW